MYTMDEWVCDGDEMDIGLICGWYVCMVYMVCMYGMYGMYIIYDISEREVTEQDRTEQHKTEHKDITINKKTNPQDLT